MADYRQKVASIIDAAKADYATRKKVDIRYFVEYCKVCLEAKDGYIMGSYGQDPKKLGSYYYDQYENNSSQYKKALYWKEHCERVHDCQGMVEGFLTRVLGKTINVYARTNYAQWCAPKQEVSKASSIPREYRIPGSAVFTYSASSGRIVHVGYLIQPVNSSKPEGDWYVIEARGVSYGVVRTKLYSRTWNRVGLMTKYFDYSEVSNSITIPDVPTNPDTNRDGELGSRTLKYGCKGSDVQELQSLLIELGFNVGKYGADGDFGSSTRSAVKAFQKSRGLEEDGIVGKNTLAAIRKSIQATESSGGTNLNPTKKMVQMTSGASTNIREIPNEPKIIGTMRLNQSYPFTGEVYKIPSVSESDFYGIEYLNGQKACISSKYTSIVDK